ncbi:hypothetical protein ACB092_02G247700 [Castanea dentata]
MPFLFFYPSHTKFPTLNYFFHSFPPNVTTRKNLIPSHPLFSLIFHYPRLPKFPLFKSQKIKSSLLLCLTKSLAFSYFSFVPLSSSIDLLLSIQQNNSLELSPREDQLKERRCC